MADRMFLAALNGNAAKLQTLLDKGSDPNELGDMPPYYRHVPALVAAAMQGHQRCVDALLAAGADPNLRAVSVPVSEKPGMSALVAAIAYGSKNTPAMESIVRSLLAAKADPDGVHGEAELPMEWAIRNNSPNVVDELLKAGASLHLCHGFRVFHEAAAQGMVDRVKQFLDGGISPDLKDDFDTTALHYAARQGKVDVARLLIKSGANVNHSNPRGWTPLHTACEHASTVGLDENYASDFALITLLLENGADVNCRTNSGDTPLVLVQEHAKPVAEFLTSRGA